jgi:fructose-bisphosphate aldolase class 1
MLSIAYNKLKECNVLLEGTLLNPSMTVTGVDYPKKLTPANVARCLAGDAQAGDAHPPLCIPLLVHLHCFLTFVQ